MSDWLGEALASQQPGLVPPINSCDYKKYGLTKNFTNPGT